MHNLQILMMRHMLNHGLVSGECCELLILEVECVNDLSSSTLNVLLEIRYFDLNMVYFIYKSD
jgi:hypothetical protein